MHSRAECPVKIEQLEPAALGQNESCYDRCHLPDHKDLSRGLLGSLASAKEGVQAFWAAVYKQVWADLSIPTTVPRWCLVPECRHLSEHLCQVSSTMPPNPRAPVHGVIAREGWSSWAGPVAAWPKAPENVALGSCKPKYCKGCHWRLCLSGS